MSIESQAKEFLKNYKGVWSPVYCSNAFWLGANKEEKLNVRSSKYGKQSVYCDCCLTMKQEENPNNFKNKEKVIDQVFRTGTYTKKYEIKEIEKFNYVVFASKSATRWICFTDDFMVLMGFKDDEYVIKEKVPMKITSAFEAMKIAVPFIEGKLSYNPKNYA